MCVHILLYIETIHKHSEHTENGNDLSIKLQNSKANQFN